LSIGEYSLKWRANKAPSDMRIRTIEDDQGVPLIRFSI